MYYRLAPDVSTVARTQAQAQPFIGISPTPLTRPATGAEVLFQPIPTAPIAPVAVGCNCCSGCCGCGIGLR